MGATSGRHRAGGRGGGARWRLALALACALVASALPRGAGAAEEPVPAGSIDIGRLLGFADLSGTWVWDGGPSTTCRTEGTTYTVRGCADNGPAGSDYFELRATGTELASVARLGRKEPTLRVSYEGLYHHHHGHRGRGTGRVISLACHIDTLTFPLRGTVDYSLASGAYDVTLSGRLAASPEHDHATTWAVADWRREDSPVNFEEHLLRDDKMMVSLGGGEVKAGTAGQTPDGCGGSLVDRFAGADVRSGNYTLVATPVAFRRGDVRDVRGVITGRVVAEDDPSVVVDQGTVDVLRAGDGRPVARGTLDADGHFAIGGVPVYDPRADGVAPSAYTVRVLGPRAEASRRRDGFPLRYYGPGEVRDAKPFADVTVRVAPLVELTEKRRLTDGLIELSLERYGPVESAVIAHLESIVAGGRDPSAAELEGVRRAIWAERAALEGARTSKDMINQLADNLAGLFGNIWDDVADFSRAGLGEAKQLHRERGELGAGDLDRLQSQLKLTDQQMKRWRDGTLTANEVVSLSAVSGALKAALKAGSAAVADGLKAFGVETGVAGELAGMFRTLATIVLSAGAQASVAGGLKPVIKQAIEGATKLVLPVLFDGNVGGTDRAPLLRFDLGVAYTALTAPALADTRDRTAGWATVDRDAYDLAASAAAATTNALVGEWAATNADVANWNALVATSDATGDLIDLFNPGPGPPRFPVVAALAAVNKAVLYLNNVAAVVAPFRYAFGLAPREVDAAACAIWGRSGTAIGNLYRTAAPRCAAAGPNRAGAARAAPAPAPAPVAATGTHPAVDAARGAAARFEEHAGSLSAALAAGELGLALDVVLGDLRDASREMLEATTVAATPLPGADRIAGAEVVGSTRRALAAASGLEAEASQGLDRLIGLVAGGVATGDRAYLARRDGLVALLGDVPGAMAALRAALDDLEARTPPPDRPVVAVTIETIESETTGLGTVTGTDERFRVAGRARNWGRAAAPATVARLRIDGEGAAVAGPDTVAVDALGPGQSREVAWTVTHAGGDAGGAGVILTAAPGGADGGGDGSAAPALVAVDGDRALLVDAEVWDPDLDGLPTAWEEAHGTDPGRADASDDPDGDGLVNSVEADRGTDPTGRDSDGDGRPDGADPRPLTADPGGDDPPEPRVALDRTKVTLTPDQPFAVVLVDNAGDGPLAWGAHTVDPTIARTALPAGDTRGPGLLLIGPGRGVDLATDRFSTRVAVVDASGTTPDHAVVEVTVGTGEPSGDPATPAPGGSPDPAEDGTAAAPAGGGGGVPWVPVLLVLAAGTLGYAGRDRLRALRSRHRR